MQDLITMTTADMTTRQGDFYLEREFTAAEFHAYKAAEHRWSTDQHDDADLVRIYFPTRQIALEHVKELELALRRCSETPGVTVEQLDVINAALDGSTPPTREHALARIDQLEAALHRVYVFDDSTDEQMDIIDAVLDDSTIPAIWSHSTVPLPPAGTKPFQPGGAWNADFHAQQVLKNS